MSPRLRALKSVGWVFACFFSFLFGEVLIMRDSHWNNPPRIATAPAPCGNPNFEQPAECLVTERCFSFLDDHLELVIINLIDASLSLYIYIYLSLINRDPICSMYATCTYIWLKHVVNLVRYSSPMKRSMQHKIPASPVTGQSLRSTDSRTPGYRERERVFIICWYMGDERLPCYVVIIS